VEGFSDRPFGVLPTEEATQRRDYLLKTEAVVGLRGMSQECFNAINAHIAELH
jgi:hypothetical protein